jgi:hypothetical protein
VQKRNKLRVVLTVLLLGTSLSERGAMYWLHRWYDADEESGEAGQRRAEEEWFKRRHSDGGARQKAIAERDRLKSAAAATSSQWRPIGPQPINQPNFDVVSGRVWGIAIDPRNSSSIYIGTDAGGVWNTMDGGNTWTPLTDNQPNINIRDLALAPSSRIRSLRLLTVAESYRRRMMEPLGRRSCQGNTSARWPCIPQIRLSSWPQTAALCVPRTAVRRGPAFLRPRGDLWRR